MDKVKILKEQFGFNLEKPMLLRMPNEVRNWQKDWLRRLSIAYNKTQKPLLRKLMLDEIFTIVCEAYHQKTNINHIIFSDEPYKTPLPRPAYIGKRSDHYKIDITTEVSDLPDRFTHIIRRQKF